MPFFLTGAAILLWFNIGVAGLIGLAVAIIHLPIIFYFGKFMGKIRFVTAAIGDSRMKLITNLIEGIRIVKLYAWENPYLNSLFLKRAQEIRQHKKKSLVSSANKSLNYGSMGLILFVTFTIYVALGNTLDPSTAFASMTILIMSTSLISIVGSLGMIQIYLVKTACQRISQGLLLKEKNRLSLRKA
jgi:ATP-binding cassette subfamily C (CFTR/MRP) protein 4